VGGGGGGGVATKKGLKSMGRGLYKRERVLAVSDVLVRGGRIGDPAWSYPGNGGVSHRKGVKREE